RACPTVSFIPTKSRGLSTLPARVLSKRCEGSTRPTGCSKRSGCSAALPAGSKLPAPGLPGRTERLHSCRSRRMEEALQVAFVYRWLARSDVAQLALLHPLLQAADQTEQVIE